MDDAAPGIRFTAGQLRALLRIVRDSVLLVDAEGIIGFASGGVGVAGYGPDDLVGRSILELLHPAEHEHVLERLARWRDRDGEGPGPTVRIRTVAGGWMDVTVDGVTGPLVAPFAAALTLRPVEPPAVTDERLTRIASAFVHLPAERIDDGIPTALAEMGGLPGVDRVCLVVREPHGLHHTHEWTAPGVPSLLARHRLLPERDIPVVRALARLETVYVPDVEALDDSWAAERAFWRSRGTLAVAAVPLVDEGRWSGFVAFESVAAAHPGWDDRHLAALRSAAGIIAQVRARQRAERQLAHQARHDPLTGMANRWAFLERLHEAAAALAGRAPGPRGGGGIAVLLFDLDRFKVVNDSLGHTAGDALLRAVANRLAGACSSEELVARLGGDELVVLATGVRGRSDAVARAEQLRRMLEPPLDVEGHETYLTASVGVAYVSQAPPTAEDLLRDADVAMFEAKARGRNRVECFDEALRSRVQARLRREGELRRAVRSGELTLHYQPEVRLDTGEVIGAEALLRWEHPRLGLLPAAEFIELAEETGITVELGPWVLERACRQLAHWQQRFGRSLLMRVNLSARQVGQPDLVPVVERVLVDEGVPPSSLCLEITETTLMADAEVSLAVLEKLRGLGVELAVDDFGTGYSSLAYLKRFPVDVVKVDRSFVSGLGTDPDDTAIVTAVVGLAAALGLTVTAEGVETVEQRDELLRLGCQRAQGFLLAPPMPPEAFSALLAR